MEVCRCFWSGRRSADVTSDGHAAQKAVALLHDTELAVRTFQRTHRWRAAGKVWLSPAPPAVQCSQKLFLR